MSSYFQQIQIWKHNHHSQFRFHVNDNSPIPPEWKKHPWKKDWKLYKTFYAFSDQYKGYLSRGYCPVRIVNKNTYPFQSLFVDTPMSSFFYPNTEKFLVFLYPFLETIPLFISTNVKLLHDVVLYDKQESENKALHRLYNFFPSEYGNTIPWYKKYTPYSNSKFFYVFPEPPDFSYWTLNTEKIIVPCKTKGFPSLEKAVAATHERLTNGFSQGNKSPIIEMTKSCCPLAYITLLLLFCFCFLLLWMSLCYITHRK